MKFIFEKKYEVCKFYHIKIHIMIDNQDKY